MSDPSFLLSMMRALPARQLRRADLLWQRTCPGDSSENRPLRPSPAPTRGPPECRRRPRTQSARPHISRGRRRILRSAGAGSASFVCLRFLRILSLDEDLSGMPSDETRAAISTSTGSAPSAASGAPARERACRGRPPPDGCDPRRRATRPPRFGVVLSTMRSCRARTSTAVSGVRPSADRRSAGERQRRAVHEAEGRRVPGVQLHVPRVEDLRL